MTGLNMTTKKLPTLLFFHLHGFHNVGRSIDKSVLVVSAKGTDLTLANILGHTMVLIKGEMLPSINLL